MKKMQEVKSLDSLIEYKYLKPYVIKEYDYVKKFKVRSLYQSNKNNKIEESHIVSSLRLSNSETTYGDFIDADEKTIIEAGVLTKHSYFVKNNCLYIDSLFKIIDLEKNKKKYDEIFLPYYKNRETEKIDVILTEKSRNFIYLNILSKKNKLTERIKIGL